MEQLPQMNPYPAERSVLVLDNCRIHHNDAIVELVHAAGQWLLSLKVVTSLTFLQAASSCTFHHTRPTSIQLRNHSVHVSPVR
jgi:hypothetical protein